MGHATGGRRVTLLGRIVAALVVLAACAGGALGQSILLNGQPLKAPSQAINRQGNYYSVTLKLGLEAVF